MGPSERPPMRMHLFLQMLSSLLGGGGSDSKAMSDGLLLY